MAAAGLYASASTCIARYLTDGVIPRAAMRRFLEEGDTAPLQALLAVGYVRESEDGYELPEYLEANPTREFVEKRRADVASRKAKWRADREAERAAGHEAQRARGDLDFDG